MPLSQQMFSFSRFEPLWRGRIACTFSTRRLVHQGSARVGRDRLKKMVEKTAGQQQEQWLWWQWWWWLGSFPPYPPPYVLPLFIGERDAEGDAGVGMSGPRSSMHSAGSPGSRITVCSSATAMAMGTTSINTCRSSGEGTRAWERRWEKRRSGLPWTQWMSSSSSSPCGCCQPPRLRSVGPPPSSSITAMPMTIFRFSAFHKGCDNCAWCCLCLRRCFSTNPLRRVRALYGCCAAAPLPFHSHHRLFSSSSWCLQGQKREKGKRRKETCPSAPVVSPLRNNRITTTTTDTPPLPPTTTTTIIMSAEKKELRSGEAKNTSEECSSNTTTTTNDKNKHLPPLRCITSSTGTLASHETRKDKAFSRPLQQSGFQPISFFSSSSSPSSSSASSSSLPSSPPTTVTTTTTTSPSSLTPPLPLPPSKRGLRPKSTLPNTQRKEKKEEEDVKRRRRRTTGEEEEKGEREGETNKSEQCNGNSSIKPVASPAGSEKDALNVKKKMTARKKTCTMQTTTTALPMMSKADTSPRDETPQSKRKRPRRRKEVKSVGPSHPEDISKEGNAENRERDAMNNNNTNDDDGGGGGGSSRSTSREERGVSVAVEERGGGETVPPLTTHLPAQPSVGQIHESIQTMEGEREENKDNRKNSENSTLPPSAEEKDSMAVLPLPFIPPIPPPPPSVFQEVNDKFPRRPNRFQYIQANLNLIRRCAKRSPKMTQAEKKEHTKTVVDRSRNEGDDDQPGVQSHEKEEGKDDDDDEEKEVDDHHHHQGKNKGFGFRPPSLEAFRLIRQPTPRPPRPANFTYRKGNEERGEDWKYRRPHGGNSFPGGGYERNSSQHYRYPKKNNFSPPQGTK